MKNRLFIKGTLFFALFILNSTGFADNPVIQTCYTADPAPMVYNGRVYMYVGHDSDGAASNYLMRNWKCYSSVDMVNWTDHGVMLSTSSLSWSTSKDANAAQVIYRNGKFYYYVSTTDSDSGGVCIGVAVSNSPTGPFKDTLGRPLVSTNSMTGCNATHSWRGLDPTVIIDDDGQAYLYWGNNVFYWITLNSNMISYSGSVNCLAQNDTASFGPDYEEGPWVYKHNSIYYLVYPSGLPECICYTTSSGPTGPWKYKSKIMAVDSYGCSTIHPGVCDFNGNSYFFYHNAALTGGGSYKRSVCIEKFTYNADGTIPTINMTTSGPAQIGNLNPYDTTQAETICWESGVETGTCSDGGIEVDSIHNGDYIKVKGVNFGSGAKSFIARVSSATSGGNIELHLDSLKGTIAGTCSIAGTGSWKTWATDSCNVTGADGIHDLYLKFTGSGSGQLFNFNWWKFINTTTGTASTVETMYGYGNRIKIEAHADHIILNFPKSVSPGAANVSLFDMTGRLVATLFTGRLSSSLLSLSLNSEHIRQGAYIIRASLDNSVTLSKNIVVFNKQQKP